MRELQKPESRTSNFNTLNHGENYTFSDVHFNHIEHIDVNSDSKEY